MFLLRFSMEMLGSLAAFLLDLVLLVFFVSQTAIYVVFTVLRNPLTSLKKKVRQVPPAAVLDSSLGTHKYVTANGIKFHIVAAGDQSKHLMLCLHGFPEFWFSWRYQLKEFSKDYNVVAVDLRGYGDTEKPSKKSDYTPSKLTQDIVELVSALGYDKCTLVSHDWGGAIAWNLVQNNPGIVNNHIVMNCPHPKVFQKHIAKSWKQVFMSWYMLMFQVPWLPEIALSLNDFSELEALYKKSARNKHGFSDDVIEVYKYTFSQPGALTPPINYYRSMDELESISDAMIQTPTLILWGDDDEYLDRAMADLHATICINVTVRHIPDCSHWIQQDRPELVNQYMRDFLKQSH